MKNSINMTRAMDSDRVEKLGRLFGSIDFEMNSKVSADYIKQHTKSTHIGTFHIGNHQYELTLAEVEQVIHTMTTAKETFFKSYKLGRY